MKPAYDACAPRFCLNRTADSDIRHVMTDGPAAVLTDQDRCLGTSGHAGIGDVEVLDFRLRRNGPPPQ